jgi:hypothetical protein
MTTQPGEPTRSPAPARHLSWSAATARSANGPRNHASPRTAVTGDSSGAALPPQYRQELSPQARWLFRTLRAAGHDRGDDGRPQTAGGVAGRAGGVRDLTTGLPRITPPREVVEFLIDQHLQNSAIPGP